VLQPVLRRLGLHHLPIMLLLIGLPLRLRRLELLAGAQLLLQPLVLLP